MPGVRPASIVFATGAAWRMAVMLTAIAVPLAVLAALAGLLMPDELYGEPGLAAIIQGQDLVTLATVPLLAASMWAARRGSARAVVVWAGLLGYLLYTYTGAALVYDFNRLFPVYLALFSLSGFALVALAVALDVEAFRARFDGREPRRAVAVFLALMAVVLAIGEVGQVVAAVVSGTAPVIAGTDAPLNFIFALDLGAIVPLSLIAAAWLWRGAPWGYLLGGLMLVKAATMGLALISMAWFAERAGLPGDPLVPLWGVIAAGGFAGTVWLLRHCRPTPRA